MYSYIFEKSAGVLEIVLVLFNYINTCLVRQVFVIKWEDSHTI